MPSRENTTADELLLPAQVLLGAAIAASMGIGYAIGAQPHMDREHRTAAIGARLNSPAATPNKGGYRERAPDADRPGDTREVPRRTARLPAAE